MKPITDKQISELISLIYDASHKRSSVAWAAVYRRIAETISNGSEHLILRVTDEERLELTATVELSRDFSSRDSSDELIDGPGREVRVSVNPADEKDGLRENPNQRTKSQFDFKPIPVDDPKVRRPDITLAKKLLGWEPKVSFEEGIAKTIEFFRGRVAAGDPVA